MGGSTHALWRVLVEEYETGESCAAVYTLIYVSICCALVVSYAGDRNLSL